MVVFLYYYANIWYNKNVGGKNMIKLVASDLDGTIIDKAGSIYENNFKAINDLN